MKRTHVFRPSGKKVGAAVVAAALVTSLMPGISFAVTSEEKQAEADAALAQLNEMQAQLETAENTYYAAQVAHDEAVEKCNDAQTRIDEASARVTQLQAKLGARARSMYRSGADTMLDVLLGSTTFEEFATNWDMLDMMNKSDAALTKETKETRIEIEAQKVILNSEEQNAAAAENEANEIRANAEATTAQMAEVYNNLSAEAAELLEQERAAQEAAEAAAAQAVVEAAAAQAAAAEASTDSSSTTTDTTSTSTDSTTTTTSTTTYDASTGNAIVDRAYSWVGNAEYVWGACSPGAFDCSGFVSYCLTGVYSRIGTTYTFLAWGAVSDPQPGDVAVNSGHCGIYIGNGQMIHCATYGVGVIVGPVQSGMIIVRY